MVEEIPCKPGVWSVFHKAEGGKVAAPTMGLVKEEKRWKLFENRNSVSQCGKE